MEDVSVYRLREPGHPRSRSSWTLLGLVVLATLLMVPTFRTGYLSDDCLTSMTPGRLGSSNLSV